MDTMEISTKDRTTEPLSKRLRTCKVPQVILEYKMFINSNKFCYIDYYIFLDY